MPDFNSVLFALTFPFMSPSASMCLEPALVADAPVQAPKAKSLASKSPKRKTPSASLKASTVLEQVQKYYAGAKDFQARFKQRFWDPALGVDVTSHGWLRVQRPSLMQWDYDGKGQDIFVNGSDVWFVDHEVRQVISSKVSAKDNVIVGMKFLFGESALLRDYLVRFAKGSKLRRYGDADHWVLQLKPRKKNPHFKGLLIVVDKKVGRVDRFVVYAHDKSSNTFELKSFKKDVGFDAGIFKKKIPAGYVQTRE